MSQWLSSVLLRFFAGGVLCSLVMMIAGEGSQREIARISCAALLIILILAPVKQLSLSESQVFQPEIALDSAVDDALKNACESQKTRADQTLQTQIEMQAQANGAACRAIVISEVSEGGEYLVHQIMLRFTNEPAQDIKNQVMHSAALLCGIGIECVVEEVEELS